MKRNLRKKIFDRNSGDLNAALFTKLAVSALYIISAVILEITMFILMNLGFAPYYIALDFAILFILAAVLFAVPDMSLQRVLFWIFLGVQMLLVLANCSLYKYHGDVFSLGILGFAREGAAVLELDMIEVRCIPIFVIVIILNIYLMGFAQTAGPRKFPVSKRTIAALMAVFMWGTAVGVTVYNVQSRNFDDSTSDARLYETLMFKNAAMRKFGSFGYYLREITGDIATTISTDKTRDEVVAYLNDYVNADNSANDYLANAGTPLNGDNVIAILMESLEWYMIDPLLTPTLTKLFTGYNFSLDNGGREIGYGAKSSDMRGIVFKEYYSKSKTDYTEANVLLGSYPYYDSFSTHLNLSNPYSVNEEMTGKDFGFSMPNMLKTQNGTARASYLHTYLSSFYGRPTIFPMFGFDETMFIEDLGVPFNTTIGNPILDSDAIDVELEDGRRVIDYLLPVDMTFFTMYATISTHGPYTYYDMYDKYYREIDRLAGLNRLSEDLLNDNVAVNAMAKAMDLDAAMAKIIAHLQKTDMIDNTTLLLFSDHQAYYQKMDLNYKAKYAGYESLFDPMRYNIPGLIYSTKLDYLESDKFFTYFDYAPTLYDLMGIKYNPKIYLGESLFSDKTTPCIISRTGGVLNDKIFTMDGEILKFKKVGVTDNDLKVFAESVSRYIDKWEYVDYMYYYDIYGDLK